MKTFVSGFKISQTFFLPSCLGYSKFHFKAHFKRFKGFVVSTSREQFPSFKVSHECWAHPNQLGLDKGLSIDVELPFGFC